MFREQLGEGSSYIEYDSDFNLYSITDTILKDKFGFGERSELRSLMWKWFRLIRAFKMYSDYFAINDKYTLFIEPYKTCNLNCSYCYAEPVSGTTHRLDFGRLEEIIKDYNIKDIRIFGGEPLLDFGFNNLLLKLFEKYPDTKYFISTNGICIDEDVINAINKVDCTLQISIEPPEWKQRVNVSGVSQFSLIEPKLKLLNGLNTYPIFRLSVPSDIDIPFVSLTLFVEKLAQLKGNWNFALGVWPTFGRKLPVWIDDWISEGHRIIDNKHLRYKMSNKYLWTYFYSILNDFMSFPFYNLNCNAGLQSIAISPDGEFYSCHEYAVITSKENKIGTRFVEPDLRFDVVNKYIRSINTKKECESCSGKYLCGGICFTKEIESACEYIKKIMPLFLRWIQFVSPRSVFDWEIKTRKFLGVVMQEKETISKFVEEGKWKQYYSGGLQKDEVQTLGLELQSILQKTAII